MPAREKPLAQHIAEGTYIPSRHADRMPDAKFDGGIGDRPSHLRDEAAEHWDWLVSSVPADVQTRGDRVAFEMMCRLYQEYIRHSNAAMDFLGTEDGETLQAMSYRAFDRWRALARDYGLTAATRTKIKTPVAETEEVDPLSVLQQRHLRVVDVTHLGSQSPEFA